MSKERLDFDVEREMNRLKKIVNKDDSFTLTSRFVKHLIEQAERVQELEKRIKIYQKRSWFEEYEKVVKQNKRYREVFESISDKQLYINYTESELYRLIIAEINNFLLEENK